MPSEPADRVGSLLLSPDALVALGVLLLNDRVLKGRGPGWATGKLSDVAGLYLFPLVLVACVEVATSALGRSAPQRAQSMALAAIATVTVFGTMKTIPVAGDVYQVVFGFLRWPLSATESWLGGGSFAAPANVHLTRDATDLVTLPMAGLAWWVHGRRPHSSDRR